MAEIPSQAPTAEQMQGGDESQAPSYVLNENIGLNEPLGKDERMMMDTRNGITTAVPLNMSDQEANFHIENQDAMGKVPPKSPEYNRIMSAIQTGGASEQVFQPWKQVTADFLKNGLQGLSMNVYKPSDAEEQFYQTFQKGTSQFDQTLGQLGAFVGVGKVLGVAGGLASLGLGAMGVGVLPDAFTGLIAKFGMEGAKTISTATAAAANMEVSGTIVQATSKTQSELKEGETPDYAKNIEEGAEDSAKWAFVMAAGAAIAKPFEGMSNIGAASELFKRATFAGGTTYALMRADNSSHEDSLLGATLMTGLALVHGGGELMDAAAHGKIGQEAINAYARYIKQSNFAIPEPNAYEIGKQVVTDTAKQSVAEAPIDQSKEYQEWLEKNAQSSIPENPNMSVPLHPAEEGKAAAALLRNNIDQYSDKDIEDIKAMMNWEKDQQDGGVIISGGTQTEEERHVTYTTSGHSQAMQDIGPQESYRLMDKAIKGDNLIRTEPDKMKKLLDDFIKNVKPNLDGGFNQAMLTHEGTESLMNHLVSQSIFWDEGEETLNRGEETPKAEGEQNAESGRGSIEEGSGQTQGLVGQAQEGNDLRNNEKTGMEAKAGEVGNQEPIKTEGEQKKSRMYERVMGDVDEQMKDNPLYNEMNMKEHVEKAIALQKSDPDLVKRVANGLEPAPEGYSETALRSAHYQAMRDAGNGEEASRAIMSDTLRGTRLGQEINMYKMYGKDGSEQHAPETFIKKAIQDRIKEIGKSIPGKGTSSEKFFKEVDKQKAQVKDVIEKSKLSDDDIQKVIDSIICP